MKEFARNGFSLRRSPRPLRMAYGAFLVLIAPGFLSQAAFQAGRIGLTPAAVAAYYRGSEQGDVMTFPKTAGQLLEVTHAHAFTMAVIFLVLAHLFVSTELGSPVKRAVLVLTFAGTVGDLLGPWIVRYGAAWCAWILLASWAAAAAGNATLIGVCAWECLAVRV